MGSYAPFMPVFIMSYGAIDWAPVAQLPTYAKTPFTSPPFYAPGRKASQQLLPGATPRLPQAGLLAQFKALEGITHPSKTSGATPAGALARTHRTVSFKTNKPCRTQMG
jgi:hypothetical protein